ncbi:MAG: hypothetical protein JRF55_06800, partial [Deltaproteobacteria bacterium]|nr:hypothetical protein [Deltaproteobacteria bacterium]
SAETVLRNVVIEFGGRLNTDTNRGAMEVLSGSAPNIGRSIIRESLNYGLFAQSGAGSDATDWFADNQLTANGRSPISIGSNDVSTLGANLALTGNGQDRVFVRGSTVSRANAAWSNYGVPFYLSNGILVRGGSTMAVAPGTEMRFASNRLLQVSTGTEEGTLVAAGTPALPIRMIADGGAWNGIRLAGLIQPGTVLRSVRVEDFSGTVNGGVRVDNPSTPGDRVAIVENCLVQSGEAGSVGVYLSGNARVSSFENNVLDVDGMSVNATLGGFDDLLSSSNTYEAPLRVRGSSITGEDMVWSRPIASDSSTQPIQPTGGLTVTSGSLTIHAGNQIESAPFWNRIRLRGSGSAGTSRITHAVLEAAGSDPALGVSSGRAAIVVENNGAGPATPAVSNTMIVNSNGYGMTFANSTHCGAGCNDNTITGSRFAAVRMHANFIGRFGTGNALAGNNTSATPGHEGMWVAGDAVDETAIVVQGNIELRRSTPLDPLPVLTVEPGSELRFASGVRLRVGDGNDGALDARGTSSQPITFTSVDTASPVFWRGIDFGQGSDGSMLDWVVVSYGGSGANTGNVNLRSGSSVVIGAVVFAHSADYAAVIYSGSAPMFTGPSADRVYTFNGQRSNPGVGDPAFDCVRDIGAGICTQM